MTDESVWYLGSGTRIITIDEWNRRGATATKDNIWASFNGWSVPITQFNEAQLAILDGDNRFHIGERARIRPGLTTNADAQDSSYAYYRALREMYNDYLFTGPVSGQQLTDAIAGLALPWISVNNLGADPTGNTPSDIAVAAAISQLGSKPGIIMFGIGKYRLDNPKVLSHACQFFQMQGVGLTTIDYRGTGAALRIWDSTSDPTGTGAPGRGGGILGGCLIDGTLNNNNNSIGLMLGDLIEAKVDHTRIVGFTRAGAIGFLLHNRYGWLEYSNIDVQSDYNTNSFVIEAHPDHPRPTGTTSYSYNNFKFGFSAEANQNGVVIRNHVTAIGLDWTIFFNCNPGDTNTGVAFTFGGDVDDYVHIEGELNWQGETTNPGAVGHKDFIWTAKSSWPRDKDAPNNGNIRGHGTLVFADFSAPFVAGNIEPWDYIINFAGRVDSPGLGHYARYEMQFVTIGDTARLSAHGNNGRYVVIEEGDSNGSSPLISPKVSYGERTWDPVNRVNVEADVSIGLQIRSRFSSTETKKSLIIIDDVNVVETLDNIGTNVRFGGHVTDPDGLYVKIGSLPPGEDKGASLQLSGRMGGFELANVASWNILLTNRNFILDTSTSDPDDYILDNKVHAFIQSMGDVWSTSPIWDIVNLKGYRQVDNSIDIWFHTNQYYIYNLLITAYDTKVDWDFETVYHQINGGNPPVTPTGTLIWTLSEEDQFDKSLPITIAQKEAYTDDVSFAQGAITFPSSAPEHTFEIFYGATNFGGTNDIYFGSHPLRDIGQPAGYNDAVPRGFIETEGIPGTPTSSGKRGQMAADSNYFYRCVADNVWRRSALGTW